MLSLFLVAVDWEAVPYLVTLDQGGIDYYLTTAFSASKARNKALSDNFECFIWFVSETRAISEINGGILQKSEMVLLFKPFSKSSS